MNEHEAFLRKEAEGAMGDGFPTFQHGWLTAAADEIARLEGIVADAYKTADGVVVTAGMKLYAIDPTGYIQGLDVTGIEKRDDSSLPSQNYTPVWACHSTREAAESAAADAAHHAATGE